MWWYEGGSRSIVEEFGVFRLYVFKFYLKKNIKVATKVSKYCSVLKCGGMREAVVEEFGVRRLLGNSKAHQPTTLLMNIILSIIILILIILIIIIIIVILDP